MVVSFLVNKIIFNTVKKKKRQKKSVNLEKIKPTWEDKECSLNPLFFQFLGLALFLPLGSERNTYIPRINSPFLLP